MWKDYQGHQPTDDGNCYCKRCIAARNQERAQDREEFRNLLKLEGLTKRNTKKPIG